jgi:hypothetical protein
MARRTNYSFEKHQKETKRKKKQAEKLEKKRLAKEAAKGSTEPVDEVPATTDATGSPVDEPSQASE